MTAKAEELRIRKAAFVEIATEVAPLLAKRIEVETAIGKQYEDAKHLLDAAQTAYDLKKKEAEKFVQSYAKYDESTKLDEKIAQIHSKIDKPLSNSNNLDKNVESVMQAAKQASVKVEQQRNSSRTTPPNTPELKNNTVRISQEIKGRE